MSKRIYHPLDLSALAYPMMKSRHTQSNFRYSARLFEAVDPDLLLKSLSEVIPFYPNLKTEIVPAFFWHRFAENDRPLIVKEDDRPPLAPLRKKDTNGYPFRLAYKGDEIILEVFHAATDGNIGAFFLSDILTRYVELKEALEKTDLNRELITEDAFIRYAKKKTLGMVGLSDYNGTGAVALGKRRNYRKEPVLLSKEIEVEALKAAAKAQEATVTEYVAACYISAILAEQPLPLKKPICLFLPVNLRRFFPSDTLQNFVCFERISLPKGTDDLSFGKILDCVKKEFSKKITSAQMQRHVDDVKLCFNLPFVKYLPLFIKSPSFRLCKKLMDKVRQTAILSNVGKITLPPETAKRVRDVKFFLNISKNTPLNVAVVSYESTCNVDITCGLKDTALPERFFALLTDQGKK